MQRKRVDYVIVGQGLAGSCLALQLLERGRRILVIDRPDAHAATLVAAGLFNPVSGRNMTKAWMADVLFPYLHDFYQRAENKTGLNFFFPMPVYRPFVSVEEQNEWMGKSSDREWSEFIEHVHTTPLKGHPVENPFGGLWLKQSGFIDTRKFVNAVATYTRSAGFYLQEKFVRENLIIANGVVRYKDWEAGRIVFCTGEKVRQDRYFSWLPIRPLKGETLNIETNEQTSVIYNRGVYVIPGIWKVGATYVKSDHTPGVTMEGKQELTEKLNALVTFQYKIIGQDWGFRPTTPDRKPILGSHPEHEQLVVFNGLGTKGVSLAPYFSGILCEWMETGSPLHDSVSVNRYKSLYSKSS